MNTTQVLSMMDQALDELINNANRLKYCDEASGECAALEYQQEMLLSALLTMNHSLDETEKQLMLQRSPRLYCMLDEKIEQLSHLNQQLLQPSPECRVKKARLHHRGAKKELSQTSFEMYQ